MYRRFPLTNYNQLYAEQVFKSLDENDNAKIDLKHLFWSQFMLIGAYSKIALKNDLIKGAFERVGLY